MKTNKLKKFFISLLVLFTIFTIISPSTNTYAQSGEGLDVCTWWSANGFSSRKQCDKWYVWKSKDYVEKNNAKIKNCMIKSSITVSVPVVISLLTGNPGAAAIEYGSAFMTCMFGY